MLKEDQYPQQSVNMICYPVDFNIVCPPSFKKKPQFRNKIKKINETL